MGIVISMVRVSGSWSPGVTPIMVQKIGGVAHKLAKEATVREQSRPRHQS